MAKKYEFKPDKAGRSLLERLYLTPLQRRNVLKWVLYGLLLTVLSVLQDVIFCDLEILGASTDLVPCGIFLICILEGAQSGCVFALVASLLYLFTGTAPGPYAMVFITLIAILVTAFRQGYMRKGFPSAMICVGSAMVIYELALFAIGLFLKLTYFSRVFGFLTTVCLTAVFAPAIFFVGRAICSLGGETWKE